MVPCAVMGTFTRRGFLAVGAQVGIACLIRPGADAATASKQLAARPVRPTRAVAPGEHPLSLGGARDGLLYVPRGYDPSVAAPLAVMLHGAGGTGRGMGFTFEHADQAGAIVLAPDSRDPRSWDAIVGRLGPDVEFIDRALGDVFQRCHIDSRRIAVGGFSDGASYALTIGLANGSLFTHVLAFSPGFIAGTSRGGRRPRVFVSHGTGDRILPIEQTSRQIVSTLRDDGYAVTYREFHGGHQVPPAIATAAFGLLKK